MRLKLVIGQHYHVSIEPHGSLGGRRVHWVASIVCVSGRFPLGRLVADRMVARSDLKLMERVCAAIRKDSQSA